MTAKEKVQDLMERLENLDNKTETIYFFLDEFIQDSKDDGRLESMNYWIKVKEIFKECY